MLQMILPAGVESEERFGEAPADHLFPEEERIIAHAVPARRGVIRGFRSCLAWAAHPPGQTGYEAA